MIKIEGGITVEAKLTALKIGVAAVIATLSDFLGWKGVLIIILALMMALDYITGTLAAKKKGEWSSKVARQGLFHKGGIIAVVLVSFLFDVVLSIAFPHIPIIGGSFDNPGIFLPLVSVWYIITETGSVMENAVSMGAPVPGWFKKAIEKAGKLVDKTGEKEAEEENGDD